jgi:diguanylate cyclase (GGDEF)-like protein
MAYRILYPLYGVVLGGLVPFAWLLWRAFSTRHDWWMKWGKAEFAKNGDVYAVIGIVAVAVFSLVGYLIAQRKNDLLEEAESIKDTNLHLEELASTDGLTGLFNARYMRERLQIEMENSRRTSFTCLLVDIDHFKRINDHLGHPFGDAALVRAADVMQRAVRRIDIVGRLGGEEFLIILPDTPVNRGMEVAERLRAAMQAETFSHDGKSSPITVSVGVASKEANQAMDSAALLKAADEALYAAKKAGRNRVVLWEPLG